VDGGDAIVAAQGLTAVQTARVVDNVDPDGGGRVRIAVVGAKAGREATPVWARLATLSAGNGRGTWFLPEIGDEVVVAFERGDSKLPIVVGSLWSPGDAVPETGPERTARTTIRTRSGALVRIEESGSTTPATITVDTSAGDTIRVGPVGIDIRSRGIVNISAAARVDINASIVEASAGTIVADTGLARFSGVVQCETLIATNVVASAYTPGAGNMQ
jgi:phage baseplate assembly protein gpV